jgi:hypothetical protein
MGMLEKIIVGATGLGYLIVCIAQFKKGATSNAMIWGGYSLAQIGLFINLK